MEINAQEKVKVILTEKYKIYYAKIWAEITWKGFNVDWKMYRGNWKEKVKIPALPKEIIIGRKWESVRNYFKRFLRRNEGPKIKDKERI